MQEMEVDKNEAHQVTILSGNLEGFFTKVFLSKDKQSLCVEVSDPSTKDRTSLLFESALPLRPTLPTISEGMENKKRKRDDKVDDGLVKKARMSDKNTPITIAALPAEILVHNAFYIFFIQDPLTFTHFTYPAFAFALSVTYLG